MSREVADARNQALFREVNERIERVSTGFGGGVHQSYVCECGDSRCTELMELTYARDGDNYLIVPSNSGAPRYPAWYHNLRAHPDTEINVGTKRYEVSAGRVMAGEADYDTLWRIVNKNNADRYQNYQKRTSRPIPVVVLRPRL